MAMKISHIGIWTCDTEALSDFYVRHFGGVRGEKYVNAAKGFESYFVRFPQGGAVEIMWRADICGDSDGRERFGIAHMALEVGGEAEVDRIASEMKDFLVSAPRRTGDGYYEAVVADPDGNRIEIVA